VHIVCLFTSAFGTENTLTRVLFGFHSIVPSTVEELGGSVGSLTLYLPPLTWIYMPYILTSCSVSLQSTNVFRGLLIKRPLSFKRPFNQLTGALEVVRTAQRFPLRRVGSQRYIRLPGGHIAVCRVLYLS
jgi:hypothetical protein